jgi:hypothetical protein
MKGDSHISVRLLDRRALYSGARFHYWGTVPPPLSSGTVISQWLIVMTNLSGMAISPEILADCFFWHGRGFLAYCTKHAA